MNAVCCRGAGRLGTRMEGEAWGHGLTATLESKARRRRDWDREVSGWRSPGRGVMLPASGSS